MTNVIFSPARALGLALALASQSHALTPFEESFKGDTLDPSAWYQTKYANGILRQNGGKLNFVTRKTATQDDYAVVELLKSAPGYNENWQLIFELGNTTSHVYGTSCGITILNSKDRNDHLYIQFFGKGVKRNGKWIGGGLIADVVTDGKHPESATIEADPRVSSGALRIRFDRKTKLLTLWASPTTKTEGYLWLRMGSFSPAGSGGDVNANWKMDPAAGSFNIQLFGSSLGRQVANGEIWIDNFDLSAPKP